MPPPAHPGPAAPDVTPTFTSPVPKQAPQAMPTPFSTNDIALIAQHLQVLSDKLSGLQSPQPSSPETSNPPPSRLLSTLSQDDIVRLVHRPGLVLPQVRPCNRANGSDTKTHWTLEALHHELGCQRFRNYKHIIQASLDGHWFNGGELSLALGAYTTIPKALRGSAIDRENSCFLDVVHVDIAFGDCISPGEVCYALIFVDRATHYNWVFGLKDLSSDSILLAFCLFRGMWACTRDASGPIAMPNCLVQRFTNTCLTTIPTLLLPPRVGYPPMALSSLIGKSWFICRVPTSQRSRCRNRFGFTLLFTQRE